ncbi:DUF5696 domain-containing protein [Cohnella nanjingensis]|uniref:Uncharacterized protein n=1 Tax=Cohnella nanjingensis TaxID=1387779 RepID=A0A7X0RU43_9BACL|nr:DUF5696 domain-containing protein [Cohnella nanjingensis]MBB6673566.1 hypothetical protein [Cohnella nanjingensis]
MNKRWKGYAVLACVVLIGLFALYFRLAAKGAPAVDIAAYAAADKEPLPAKALQFLPDNGQAVPGMKLAAQTNDAALYFNPDTAEIGVLDRRGGKLWRSNPADRDADAIASPEEKQRLSSQASINLRDSMGTLTAMTNFAESIQRKQFQAEAIENGIRVTFTLGDMSLGMDALPKRISKQRMQDKVLSKLDDATAKYVGNRYFPLKDNPKVLERLDAAVNRALVLKRMLEAFAKAGYTAEDLALDNEENGISSGAGLGKPNFAIPIEYRLDGGSLVVTVPAGQIKESKGYQIRSLELLNFFGAAGTNEQGYMLVPDGSGSLIDLNNGKFKEEVYVQRVYGDDENLNSRRRGQVAESARLPVFGLKSGDAAWLAVIEKGDGIASIQADVSGRQNAYNHVYASFQLRGEDWLDIYKGNTVDSVKLLTDSRYEGDLQVRYSFLSDGDANYSGMAKRYREKLVQDGVLKPLAVGPNLPFYLDVLGAVDKRKSFLGIPYKGMVPMTTFEQAGQIADQLKSKGISNLQMRYVGWFNGGMNHKVPAHVKADADLGSKSDLKKLADRLQSMGGKLYPDVAFQHVLRDDRNFKPASDAARFVTREQAMLSPIDRGFSAMNNLRGDFYLLSPAKLPYFVDRFIDGYKRYGLDAVSLRDLGDLLHADYRVSRVVFRDTAKNVVTEQLDKLKAQYPNLLLTGGNAYALRYADQLVNVPMGSSGFNIADQTIPFYEMVLHGYKEYAGSPINLDDEQDTADHLLRSIEYGAAPHFMWTYESSSRLKFTPYDAMFSTHYADGLDSAADMYAKANKELAGLQSRTIVEHIQHEPGVAEVRYDNGTSVYVNYTDKPVAINGVTIEAKNFAAGGDGK